MNNSREDAQSSKRMSLLSICWKCKSYYRKTKPYHSNSNSNTQMERTKLQKQEPMAKKKRNSPLSLKWMPPAPNNRKWISLHISVCSLLTHKTVLAGKAFLIAKVTVNPNNCHSNHISNSQNRQNRNPWQNRKKKQYYNFAEMDATAPNSNKWNQLTISLEGRAL